MAGVIRLRMTEWSIGQKDAPLVVALPGALAPRSSFARLGQLLGETFRFVAVDLPGQGESEKPAPAKFEYSPSRFAEALAGVLSALDGGRAHLLGHGLGGAVGIHLAARHPELVRSLALVSPAVHLAQPRPLWRFLLAPIVGDLLFRQIAGQGLYSRVYRDKIHAEARPETLNHAFESLASPAARRALLAYLRRSLDCRAVIADCRRLRCPSLLVWGREDRLLPLKEGRLLCREIANTGFEIIDTGHAPHEEAPERLAHLLGAFYQGQRAGSTTAKPPRVTPVPKSS